MFNLDQIINLYDQEDYFLRANRVRNSFRERGGHVSITTKPYLETKNSEPLLINNFCFSVSVKFYGDQLRGYNIDTTTHLSPFTGKFNKTYYKNGINSDTLSDKSKVKK